MTHTNASSEGQTSNSYYVQTGNPTLTTTGTLTTAGTTDTFLVNLLPTRELISSAFIEKENGNFIEMIFKQKQSLFGYNTINVSCGPSQEVMIKELYGVVEGKLNLISTTTGTEKPGYYVPPTIDWEE